MTRRFMIMAAGLVSVATPLAGQSPAQRLSDLHPGDRVRVEYDEGDLHVSSGGRFMGVQNDSITIERGRLQRTVPLSQVQRIQVPADRRSPVRTGVVGALIGTVAGFGLAAIHAEIRDKEGRLQQVTVCDPDCHVAFQPAPPAPSRRVEIVSATAVLGTLAGIALPGRLWRAIEIHPARAGGTAAGVTVQR